MPRPLLAHRAPRQREAPRDRLCDGGICTTIRYWHAVFDEQLGHWISHAEIAGAPFTALFSSRAQQAFTARFVLRRVLHSDPDHVAANAHAELFQA